MRLDSEITLLGGMTSGKNAMGDAIKAPSRRKIFAEKNSIRQSEFYQAASTGLKPELSFTVWTLEYQGEKSLEFEGVAYTIIRTFDKNNREMELICSGLTNGVT